MTTHAPHLRTTVVVGGSVAGLLAAAAVAPHTRRVVVVERDALPREPGPRPGTPQAAHVHGLLASGREAMEALLPGLTDDLVAQGALTGDVGVDARWYLGGHRVAEGPVGATGLLVSRALLEAYLRARARDLPNVTVLDRSDVGALLSDRDGAVTGVRLRDLEDPTAAQEELAADLVVDATGRPGRAARWFGEHGWAVPAEVKVVVGVRYTTVRVPFHDGDLGGAKVVISAPTPEVTVSAAALLQEDGDWVVGVGGYLEQQPPTDPAGLHAFAQGLVAPEIAELVSRTPLQPPQTYRFPHSVRRRVEKVRLPEGYAVLGDALCSFNPVFGQGMSVAAMQAVGLRDALGGAAGDGGPAWLAAALARHHREAVERVDRAWTLVAGSDLQVPGVVGDRAPGHAAVGAYVRRVQRTAAHDPVVARALVRVTALLDPPQALFRPVVVARVAAGARRSTAHAGQAPSLAAHPVTWVVRHTTSR